MVEPVAEAKASCLPAKLACQVLRFGLGSLQRWREPAPASAPTAQVPAPRPDRTLPRIASRPQQRSA
jgi:hypothetical protein